MKNLERHVTQPTYELPHIDFGSGTYQTTLLAYQLAKLCAFRTNRHYIRFCPLGMIITTQLQFNLNAAPHRKMPGSGPHLSASNIYVSKQCM